MSDLRYSVEIEFLSKGLDSLNKQFSAGSHGLGKKLGDDFGHASNAFGTSFAKSLDGVVDSIGSAVVGGLATAATIGAGLLTTALGVAVKDGLGANADFEASVNGIGATLSMLGEIPIDQGMRKAAEATEELRVLASKLPGSFADARNAFASIIPAGVGNGVDLKRLTKLGAQSVAVASSLGINQSVAGHELAALLEGRARSSMPLAAKLGIHAKEWNAQSADKRFAKIEDLFGRMDPAMKIFEQSWAGLTSTMKDDLTNVLRHGSMPLFDSMKGSFSRALDWYGANEDKILSSAVSYGQALRHGWEVAEAKILHWAPILIDAGKRFGAELQHGFEMIAPYLTRAEKMAERFLTGGHVKDSLFSAGAGLLGAKAATSAMSFGGDALGGIAKLGQLASVTGMSLATLGSTAGVGVVSLAALGMGAYGAVDVLTDASNTYHAGAVEAVSRIAANTTKLTEAGSGLVPLLKKMSDLYGAYLIHATAFWSDRLVEASDKLALLTNAFGSAAGAFERWAERLGFASPKLTPGGDETIDRTYAYPGFPKAFNSLPGAEGDEARAPKIINHHTTVHNTNHFKINGNTDPRRVALEVAAKLDERAKLARSNPASQFRHSP